MHRIAISILCLIGLPLIGSAQTDLTAKISERAAGVLPKVIEWRRHIHQNPEQSNREFKTAEYITAHLKSLGLTVQTGVGKTGVVALLKGAKPGPVIALRADMDALPVLERTGLPFASKVRAEYLGEEVPVMHACGHDAHVAMLMGAAEVLSGMKKDIAGTVKFIFQPAEEGPPGEEEGGAPLMIKEGVMENPKVDAIFGIHISSSIPSGEIRYKQGAYMASSDWLSIHIKGKQAHGSAPWTGIDPVTTGAQVINALQTIVSRRQNIVQAPVVITIAKFQAGIRNNIIPEEAQLDGTIRTLDPVMQDEVHARIREVVDGVAKSSGATITLNIDKKTPVTFNDSALVKAMIPALEKAAGKTRAVPHLWTTGAEDFAYYGKHAPAFFFYLGGLPPGNSAQDAPGHHTPDFLIDDSRLDVGIKAFCEIVLNYSALRAASR